MAPSVMFAYKANFKLPIIIIDRACRVKKVWSTGKEKKKLFSIDVELIPVSHSIRDFPELVCETLVFIV